MNPNRLTGERIVLDISARGVRVSRRRVMSRRESSGKRLVQHRAPRKLISVASYIVPETGEFEKDRYQDAIAQVLPESLRPMAAFLADQAAAEF